MQANLSDSEIQQINYKPTSDLTAYEYYLLGNFHSRKINNRVREKKASIKHYKNAIVQDPDFADAYAKLGESYSILAYFIQDESPAYIDSARIAVEKALRLNPMQADALNAKAYLKRTFEWDWEESRSLYLKAQAIDPNNSLVLRNYSLLLASINDLDSALKVAEKAVELDPLNDQMTENVGRMYFFSRRYAEIIDIYGQEGIAQSGQGAMHLAEAYLYNGDTAKAMELVLANIPGFVDSLQENRLSSLYQVGDYLQLTEEFIAMMSGAEEETITFDWLQNAYEKRDGYMVYILVDPVFDRFKGDPRYDSIVEKMGLDKYL